VASGKVSKLKNVGGQDTKNVLFLQPDIIMHAVQQWKKSEYYWLPFDIHQPANEHRVITS